MRPVPAGFLEHFPLIERQELLVPLWPPREGVDAIKAENMIDPEQVKDMLYAADALAPPR